MRHSLGKEHPWDAGRRDALRFVKPGTWLHTCDSGDSSHLSSGREWERTQDEFLAMTRTSASDRNRRLDPLDSDHQLRLH